jgi:hypothetical protein
MLKKAVDGAWGKWKQHERGGFIAFGQLFVLRWSNRNLKM